MTFLEPFWLVLAIPAGFALARWWPASIPSRILKAVLLATVVLALARPAWRLPSRAGTLVVLVDRSASMPAGAEEESREVLERLESSRHRRDRLAVVAFGSRAAIETSGEVPFQGFAATVGEDSSRLATALETALGMAPSSGSTRMLVISDGRWTGSDPGRAVSAAAMRGVPVDYRLLERPETGDLAVERIDAPGEVAPGEGYLVSAWIRSPARQEVEVVLRRGGRVLASGRRQVPAGRSRFTFRDRAPSSGVQSHDVSVRAAAADGAAAVDPLPENDTARFLVGVRGPRPIAVVSRGGTRTAELLERGGLDVRALEPRQFSGSLEELSGYSAVVLENVPAGELGESSLIHLASWVRSAGGGLMMTGGQESFGPGGYFRSPLEEVLPVSMELRQEHRKLALAMVVTLDRSGSMAAPAEGGRSKMDLANLAAAEVLDLLSPLDELGVVAVDSQAHVVLPLAPVGEKGAKRAKILSIDSQGGGIFVYTALYNAVEQLLKSGAGARHVLLFADAADAEEPGDYRQLLEHCRESEITVSVVGLGQPTDVDAGFLRDVARRGGGRAFFTSSPQALPRIFAQDTFVVARSTFVEQATPWRLTAGLATLSGEAFVDPPPLGGYNLTYLKPEANLAAVTVDEYEAPVVAGWQVGLGRALAYTSEVDGAFSGAVAGWPDAGSLLSSLVRWVAGESGALPAEMLVTQEFRHGALRVRLHLDPRRDRDPFTEPASMSLLRGAPGAAPRDEEAALRWSDPDTLEAVVELDGGEVVLGRVEVPGLGGAPLAPARLPYAPEYDPAEPGVGHLALERLARSTGGLRRLDVAGVWDDFDRRPRALELRAWLLALALVLLLADVLERRTAFLSSGWRLARSWPSIRLEKPRSRASRVEAPAKAIEIRAPASSGAESFEEAGVLSALDRARRRSRRRTR